MGVRTKQRVTKFLSRKINSSEHSCTNSSSSKEELICGLALSRNGNSIGLTEGLSEEFGVSSGDHDPPLESYLAIDEFSVNLLDPCLKRSARAELTYRSPVRHARPGFALRVSYHKYRKEAVDVFDSGVFSDLF